MKLKFDFLGIRAVWNDIVNYIDWIKTLKREKQNPQSKFRKYSLDYDWFRNIFVIVTLPGEDSVLPENIQRIRVTESLRPVIQYLDEDLQFGEYIVPDFNRVYRDGEPTLSFMIIFRFMFRKLTFWWLISRSIFFATLIIAGFQVPWQTLFGWILGLI